MQDLRKSHHAVRQRLITIVRFMDTSRKSAFSEDKLHAIARDAEIGIVHFWDNVRSRRDEGRPLPCDTHGNIDSSHALVLGLTLYRRCGSRIPQRDASLRDQMIRHAKIFHALALS